MMEITQQTMSPTVKVVLVLERWYHWWWFVDRFMEQLLIIMFNPDAGTNSGLVIKQVDVVVGKLLMM